MPRTIFPAVFLTISILAQVQNAKGADVGSRSADEPNPSANRPAASQAGSATWAVRLGPVVQHDSKIAPRVTAVASQNAPANPNQFVAHTPSMGQREAKPRDDGKPDDAVIRRWVAEVEIPARLRDIDSRIAVTEAKLDSFRRRQAQLAELNAYASPETLGFFPTDIWPGIETYNPVTVGGPVRSFSPRSSFSHVLATLRDGTQEAEQELESLRLEREQLVSAADGKAAIPGSLFVSDVAAARNKSLATIEAELRLAEFRRQSCEARLVQMDKLVKLTYGSGLNSLQDRLRLEHLQAELRSTDLRYVQGLVRGFELEPRRPSAGSSRIAVAE
jgi:hypothetical protein